METADVLGDRLTRLLQRVAQRRGEHVLPILYRAAHEARSRFSIILTSELAAELAKNHGVCKAVLHDAWDTGARLGMMDRFELLACERAYAFADFLSLTIEMLKNEGLHFGPGHWFVQVIDWQQRVRLSYTVDADEMRDYGLHADTSAIDACMPFREWGGDAILEAVQRPFDDGCIEPFNDGRMFSTYIEWSFAPKSSRF